MAKIINFEEAVNDRPDLSGEQVRLNIKASEELSRGVFYRFNPPVVAAGFRIDGVAGGLPQEFNFSRGRYIGFHKGRNVFQGRPDGDIPPYTNKKTGKNEYEYFFRVDFIGGSSISPDFDQSGK